MLRQAQGSLLTGRPRMSTVWGQSQPWQVRGWIVEDQRLRVRVLVRGPPFALGGPEGRPWNGAAYEALAPSRDGALGLASPACKSLVGSGAGQPSSVGTVRRAYCALWVPCSGSGSD